MKSPAEPRHRLHRLPLLAFLLAGLPLLFWACHLTQEPEDRKVFSLAALADSLAGFDSVTISLKSPGEETTLLLFRGPVSGAADLTDLPAPGYDGGAATLTVVGYKGDKVVHREERHYDGRTRTVDSVKSILLAETALGMGTRNATLQVGESVELPVVTVTPDRLADKAIVWSSSEPRVVRIDEGRFIGVSVGDADLVAALKVDESHRVVLRVRVNEKPAGTSPDTLHLSPDTLEVAVAGGAKRFLLGTVPAWADKEVTWRSADTLKARISPSGDVEGLSPGLVRAWAASKSAPAVADTAWVRVVEEVKVARVDIVKAALELIVGGVKESLTVVVEPPLADPAVDFLVRDPAKARIVDGQLEGLAEGETWVVAVSRRDASKQDSARVTISERQVVEEVTLDRRSLALFFKGDAGQLKAAVLPGKVSQAVHWVSSNPQVASVDSAGRVSPGLPGEAYVRAVSRADSLKRDSARVTVRRDVPVPSLSTRDTTVSAGSTVRFDVKVTQDYGLVTRFEWDLDGDGAFDSSAAAEKPVSYTYREARTYPVRFRITDSEGNDTVLIKNVIAVSGPVILFKTPTDQSWTNRTVIDVSWTVDGKEQTTGLTETLSQEGANPVTRSAQDDAGKEHSVTITVNRDTEAPAKPSLSGPALTRSRTPRWTWKTGGLGGNGTYRLRLDTADLASAPSLADTTYQHPTPLADGPHTLYVQERDLAGNWSPTGSLTVIVDGTAPAAPAVRSDRPLTNAARPTWTWSPGAPGGARRYRSSLGGAPTAATGTTDTSFTPSADLPEGPHTLQVQEQDSAGNWSASGSFTVRIDRTRPAAPTVASAAALTNSPRPRWTWRPGGEGIGAFRYRLDNKDLSGGTETTDTAHAPAADLLEGSHTLYVQERDSAGNWSDSGFFAVQIDRTPPGTPVPANVLPSPLNTLRPSWSWASGGNGGTGVYRAKVDTADPAGAATFTGTVYTPAFDLAEGSHRLHVQERDAAGNWSAAAATPAVHLSLRDTVGRRGLSTAGTGDLDFAMSPQGVPHFVFRDSANSQKASVMRFASGTWSYVGNAGFSAGTAFRPRIAFGPDGTPFVVFEDGANSYRPTVMAFKGGSWAVQGMAGFAFSGINCAIAVSSAGNPYVAYITGSSLRVDSLGTSWAAAGSQSINAHYKTPMSMAFATNGSLFLAFSDAGTGARGRAAVARYAAGAWTNTGSGLLADSATSVSLALHGNTPVLALAALTKASVYRLSGSAWLSQGIVGFAWATEVSLALNAAGTPFVGFPDANNRSRVAVQTLQGGNWASMSGTGLSFAVGQEVGIAVHQATGVPYVAFTEPANTRKITVMKTSFDPP